MRITKRHRHVPRTIAVPEDVDIDVDALADTIGARRSGLAVAALKRHVATTVAAMPPVERARYEQRRAELAAERQVATP